MFINGQPQIFTTSGASIQSSLASRSLGPHNERVETLVRGVDEVTRYRHICVFPIPIHLSDSEQDVD